LDNHNPGETGIGRDFMLFEYAYGDKRLILFDGFFFSETVEGETLYYRIVAWEAGNDKYTDLDNSGLAQMGYSVIGIKVCAELINTWEELDYEEMPFSYYLSPSTNPI